MQDENAVTEPHGSTRERNGKTVLDRAKASIARRYESQCVSIKVHGFVFAIGVAGFIFLNKISTPYPWAFFPIAGWIVGLGGHLRAFLNRGRELRQISRIQGCPDEAAKLLRQHQRCVGAWDQHLMAFITANAYVWGINAITSMAFPWAAFVTGLWGVGLVCHRIGNTAKRKRIERRLTELGLDPAFLRGSGLAGAAKPATGPFTAKARVIAEAMAARYRADKTSRAHWTEVAPLLGTAVAQIEELEGKCAEFDLMTASLSDDGFDRELAELREKRGRAGSSLLKKEYDRSIAQGEARLKASSDLRQHREILDLRLSSALNLIKQLEIDSVRLASLDNYEEPASIALLRAKTAENQAFLEDYRGGLDRIEEDIVGLADRSAR